MGKILQLRALNRCADLTLFAGLLAVLIGGCDPGYNFDIALRVEASALPDETADYPLGVALRINAPNPNRVEIDHPVVLAFCSPDQPGDLSWEFHNGGLGWCNGGLSATAWLGAIAAIQGIELDRRLSPRTRGKCEACREDQDCVPSMRCLHADEFEEGRCFPISRKPSDVGPSCAGSPGFAEEEEALEAPACQSEEPCPAGQGCSVAGCVPIPCEPSYYEMLPPTAGWTPADGPADDAIQATASQEMLGDPGSDGCSLELELVLGE